MSEDIKDQEVDELDSWYDGLEDEVEELGDQDPSVDDEPEEEEETSAEDSDEVDVPDDEDQNSDDADDAPLDTGNSAKPKPKGDDPYAWINELAPAYRKEAEALVNRSKSNSGRAAALQARLDEAQAKLEAARESGKISPVKAAELADKVEDMNDEELDAFMEQYPSVAANVQKLIDRKVQKEREEILGQVRPIREEAAQRRILEQKELLRKGASRIFNTADTGIELEDVINSEEWQTWLSSRPAAYQELVRNANDAATAISVLEDFDRYARETIVAKSPQPSPEEQTPSKADKVAARRKQTLAGNTPPSRSAQLDNKGLGDYESYFDEAVKSSGYK